MLNVPVYQCGERNTALQVKKHNNDISDPGLLINEKDIPFKKEAHKFDEDGTNNEFGEDAISHYIFGNFSKKKLPAVDLEDLVVTPQILSRESTSTDISLAPRVEPINSTNIMEMKDCPVTQNFRVQVSLPIELGCQELDDSSPEVKEDSISGFIFGTLKKENISTNNSPRLSSESYKLLKNTSYPRNKQVEQPEPIRFDSVSSEETYANITFTHADSLRNSYAYDGNVYPFAETDDQGADQYIRMLKGKSMTTSSYSDHVSREPYGAKRMQFYIEERLSRHHLYSKVSSTGYENYVKNQIHFGKTANFPMEHEDREKEKLKLQRIVLQLQNQLNQLQEGLMCVSPETCYKKKSSFDQCKMSHIPFSSQLHNKPTHCVNQSNHNHFNVQCSCSSCSCTYTSSDVSIRSHNTMCEIGKKIMSTAKRHVLPIKGGAPYIICDLCSKLLQLPTDFLLFRKKIHRLMCGSCSHVLKFSLRNGSQIETYMENG